MMQRLCLVALFLVPSAIAYYGAVTVTEYSDDACTSNKQISRNTFVPGLCQHDAAKDLNVTFFCEGPRWGYSGGVNKSCDEDPVLYPDAGFSSEDCVHLFGHYWKVEKTQDESPQISWPEGNRDNYIVRVQDNDGDMYVPSGACMFLEDSDDDPPSQVAYKWSVTKWDNDSTPTELTHREWSGTVCQNSGGSSYSVDLPDVRGGEEYLEAYLASELCGAGLSDCECSSSTCGVALEPLVVTQSTCGKGYTRYQDGTVCDQDGAPNCLSMDCCDGSGIPPQVTCSGPGTCECARPGFFEDPGWDIYSAWDPVAEIWNTTETTSHCKAFGSVTGGVFVTGFPITVHYQGGEITTSTDWIGLYPHDQNSYESPEDEPKKYAYTNGNANGTVNLNPNGDVLEARNYKVLMFRSDSYELKDVISEEANVTLVNATCGFHGASGMPVSCGVGFASKDADTQCGRGGSTPECIENGVACCTGVQTASVTIDVSVDPSNVTNFLVNLKTQLVDETQTAVEQWEVTIDSGSRTVNGSTTTVYGLEFVATALTPDQLAAVTAILTVVNLTNDVFSQMSNLPASFEATDVFEPLETGCDVANALSYLSDQCDVATCNAGFRVLSNKAACEEVACPAKSSGGGVATGCTPDAGYSGSVTATSVDPFYTSTLADIDACTNNPCAAGQSCTDKAAPALDDPAGRTCAACDASTFSDGTGACQAHTVIASCPAGEGYGAGTASADATCTACAGTTFNAAADATACAPWTFPTSGDCTDDDHSGHDHDHGHEMVWTSGTAATDSTCVEAPTSGAASLWPVLAVALAVLVTRV